MFAKRITKTEINELPLFKYEGKTVIAATEQQIDRAIFEIEKYDIVNGKYIETTSLDYYLDPMRIKQQKTERSENNYILNEFTYDNWGIIFSRQRFHS